MDVEILMPTFTYDYTIGTELQAVRNHQAHRGIPRKPAGKLLLATWNLCNLGTSKRRDKDLELMAEILRPFDLIAVQEVREDFRHLHKILAALGAPYKCIMTDRAGNEERLAYIFDPTRVEPQELFGELVLLEKEAVTLTFPINGGTVEETLRQFNRNPYLASWKAGQFRFTTANVHIYFGKTSGAELRRRVLEVFTLAKWAHDRVTKYRKTSNDLDIILIGDMNVPKMAPADPVFQRLLEFGMRPTKFSTHMGTNLSGVNHFDQITFLPTETATNVLAEEGVFDYDKAVFADLWAMTQGPNPTQTVAEFRRYCRYYISDHRLLWCAFDTTHGGG
jgi:endonuclease/exonuclease/phosphatase family metal-dependent hydrolase